LGSEENARPADEFEALRAIMLAELRRRPGDLGTLMRRAEAVTRLMVAQGRLAPAKEQQLRRNVELLAEYFDSMLDGGREGPK
jgi:hypothetical protein